MNFRIYNPFDVLNGTLSELSSERKDLLDFYNITESDFSKYGQTIINSGTTSFGTSVSTNSNGDRIIIGNPFNDDVASDSGQVRVYELDGSGWIQLGSNINGINISDNIGVGVGINSVGDRIVAGSRKTSIGGNDGRLMAYEYNGSDWVQLGSDIEGKDTIDRFGNYGVSINSVGNRIAGGSINHNTSTGYVGIYEYNGSDWDQLGSDIEGKAVGDQVGETLSLNYVGDRVAIGTNLNTAGFVRIYEYNGSTWVQLGSDILGAGTEQFGRKVRMNSDGDRVVASAFEGNGYVEVYEYNGSAWVQLGSRISGNSEFDIYQSVGINDVGDRIVIGAENSTSDGFVRIYDYNGSDWVQLGTDIINLSSDEFGFSVDMNAVGNTVVIGDTTSDLVETYAYW